MQYAFYTVDVFTDQIFGGNPLAVFPEAEGLTDAQMQRIATEFHYSETVFVFPPKTATGHYRLRIFTPYKEVNFAGHPTIGAAYLLSAIGKHPLTDPKTYIIFEEGVGLVRVALYSQNGHPYQAALKVSQLPKQGPEPLSNHIIADILSLKSTNIRDDQYFVQSFSCGIPFLIVPVTNSEVLAKVKVRYDLWDKFLSHHWASSIFLVTWDFPQTNPLGPIDIHARMFAPGLGIAEDPATGSAVAALGGYLSDRLEPTGTWNWKVEQGLEMGRPSLLELRVSKTRGAITAVEVAGSSIIVSQGVMEVP
ncbi:MAG: PhzF family phenazine biosynthesis protein [Cyanobacteriota bacterium]|jgi:trans-2,3-dihydro-3-hydroxyanthranilate isomerase